MLTLKQLRAKLNSISTVSRTTYVSTLLVLTLSFFVVIDFDLSFYEPQQKQSEQTKPTKQEKECCGFFKGPLVNGFVSLVRWVDDRHNLVIATGTVFIAIFTTTLFFATFGLLRLGSQQLRHAREYVDRAYIFGGCGIVRWKVTNDERKTPVKSASGNQILIVQATNGNYGKTTGFVEKVFIERYLEKDLPKTPVYKNEIPVHNALPPDSSVHGVNRTAIEFEAVDGQIYYGRFIYTDVFREEHYSSFAYRFFKDGSHEPLADRPEYWKWT